MMMSPGLSRPASAVTVSSVGAPAGSITQTARGAVSPATRPFRSAAGLAPSSASALMASALRSKTTHSWPARIRRRAMLPPMRPNPITPSCIPSILSFSSGAVVLA